MDDRFFFGIDLGTTNSVISVYDRANNTVKSIRVGESPLLKSMVSLTDTGDTLVGVFKDHQSTVRNVKSYMGDDKQTFEIKGKFFTPIQVSSMVLAKLKSAAEAEFGRSITDVTVTVPAKFNHKQRSNTVKAASMAGLNVVSLINEPTSASLAYIDTVKSKTTVLVYDLGGGTFDASIVNILPGIKAMSLRKLKIKTPKADSQMVSVICSDGNVNLGGNDVDDAIVRIALSRYDFTVTQQEFKELSKKAQELKETGAAAITWENKDHTKVATLLEDDYVVATNEIFQKTMSIVKHMMLQHSSCIIDRIVLVGGSTKNPYLVENIREEFPNIKVYSNINPDECVALGAAKNSYICKSSESTMSLFDVSSDTVGVKVRGSKGVVFDRMLEKGTVLPGSCIKNFALSYKGQTEISVDIYQGEYSNCDYNTLLGTLRIDEIPEDMPEDVGVACTFSMDKSGILECTVSVAGKKKTIVLDSKAQRKPQGKSKEDTEIEEALESLLTSEF